MMTMDKQQIEKIFNRICHKLYDDKIAHIQVRSVDILNNGSSSVTNQPTNMPVFPVLSPVFITFEDLNPCSSNLFFKLAFLSNALELRPTITNPTGSPDILAMELYDKVKTEYQNWRRQELNNAYTSYAGSSYLNDPVAELAMNKDLLYNKYLVDDINSLINKKNLPGSFIEKNRSWNSLYIGLKVILKQSNSMLRANLVFQDMEDKLFDLRAFNILDIISGIKPYDYRNNVVDLARIRVMRAVYEVMKYVTENEKILNMMTTSLRAEVDWRTGKIDYDIGPGIW